jgi:hypothetical protein
MKSKYHLDVCGATNGAHTELAQGMKKKLFVALCNGMCLIFVWLLLSYQYIYVIIHIICNHLQTTSMTTTEKKTTHSSLTTYKLTYTVILQQEFNMT